MAKRPTKEEITDIALKKYVDEVFQEMDEALLEWEHEKHAAEAAK